MMHEPDLRPLGWPRWLAIITAIMLVIIAVVLLLHSPARAHMHERPDLTEWLRTLYSKDRGSCCDSTEAETMADPDWRNASEFPSAKGEKCVPSDTKGGEMASMAEPVFCVRLENPATHEWAWWIVPAGAVVELPNRAGPALIWSVWVANNRPYIRCFLPGGGA